MINPHGIGDCPHRTRDNTKRQTPWSPIAAMMFVILLFASIAIPGCPPPPHNRLRTISELEGFAQATAAFQLQHGHRPPRASVRSVREHLLSLDQDLELNRIDVESISQLDGAERLVFWLGGSYANENIGFERLLFFDFDPSEFVDRDDDGFPEYASMLDRVFEYDENAGRVSCNFSDDALTVNIATPWTD